MRLIDADKLQRTEGIFTYRFTDDTDILSCCAYRYEDIETAPTVEAIPIEWIKKWCNEHNRKSLEERLLKRYGVITMLEDWEKENEREIDRH